MQRILNLAIFLVVLTTFINALFFFVSGFYYSIEVYYRLVMGTADERPGVMLVESLDRFLIGFVFIIFSIGFAKLFLSETSFLKNYELPWLQLKDFYQLKAILVSAVLVTLFVAWVPYAVKNSHAVGLDWTSLIFPACLLIMAVAAKFIIDLH